MLKCIRIRTCTKKKLKYNLKLLKFRKASQVLRSCQENAIIRGLWVELLPGLTRSSISCPGLQRLGQRKARDPMQAREIPV